MDELDRVIAANLRQLIAEHGWRHADLAGYLTNWGFPWTANRVAQVTTERRPMSLVELAGVCGIFGVPLTRLLDEDGAVSTGAPEAVPLATVRDFLTKGGTENWSNPIRVMYVPIAEEQAAVKRLGLPDVGALQRLAWQALGTTSITEERDRRAGESAGASERSLRAKRGHAMRGIVAELQAYLEAHPQAVSDARGQGWRQQRGPTR